MKSLITSEKVISLAFGDGEYLPPEAIGTADIVAAERRHILPIVGQELYDRLHEGAYPDLVEEYVAPALAMAVRVMVQPALNVRTGQAGLVMPSTSHAVAAHTEATRALQRSLRARRQVMLRRLSDYLKTCRATLPEYDAAHDIMQHVNIDGNIVQIH